MDLFVVQYLHVLDDGEEDVKFIGVYSAQDAAEKTVGRLRPKPGFCDTPEGFSVDRYTLDDDNWGSGYVTLMGLAQGETENAKERSENERSR